MRILASAVLLIIILATSSTALIHNSLANKYERSLSYAVMSQLSYSYMSSSFAYDQAIDENRAWEVALTGNRVVYIISASQTQFGLHYRQKLWTLGKLKIEGLAGLGGLYSSSGGTSMAADVGATLAFPFNDSVRLVAPGVMSVFSDGILFDYSLGVGYKPGWLKGNEMLVGIKGSMMALLTANQMAMNNDLFAILGLRAYL